MFIFLRYFHIYHIVVAFVNVRNHQHTPSDFCVLDIISFFTGSTLWAGSTLNRKYTLCTGSSGVCEIELKEAAKTTVRIADKHASTNMRFLFLPFSVYFCSNLRVLSIQRNQRCVDCRGVTMPSPTWNTDIKWFYTKVWVLGIFLPLFCQLRLIRQMDGTFRVARGKVPQAVNGGTLPRNTS